MGIEGIGPKGVKELLDDCGDGDGLDDVKGTDTGLEIGLDEVTDVKGTDTG